MKTRLNSKVAGIVLLMGLSVGMMQCEKQAIAEPTVEFQNLEARGGLDPATLCACLTENYATDALSDDEITALQFMRQEEKMARDVYFAMNERYDQKVFANIIRAEQQHMDAINCLLDKYRLADPVLGLGYGEFADAGLVKWYGELIEKGNKSLADAWHIKIWKNLNAYQPDLKLSSWLYRIVHNHVISVWRQKRTHGSTYTLEWDDRIINVLAEDLEEDAGTNDRLLRLQEALLALPDKYREVITLKYFEQMNYEDISDVLKIPEGTVATRLNRARQMMAKFCNQSKTKITAYGPR
ncbi:MAG: sigma-70 family RNA polymerase sigma factor [Saprospiraceae bacterium]